MKKSLLLSVMMVLILAGAGQAAVTFGVIPLEDTQIMEKKFTPLTEYLSASLGEPVTLRVGTDYEAIESALVSGELAFAYIGPVGAVKVNTQKKTVIPIVKVVKKGSPFYKSYVVAAKDSPVTDISGLKGKVFAFGDKGSTSSYLVPRYLLAKQGVALSDLKTHLLTGSHSNVVRAVLEGKAAAGGVKESVALKNKDALKFLDISKPIPNFPICANIASLGKEKAKKLQKLLEDLPADAPEIKAINAKYDGFAKATIGDYRIIQAIMKQQ